MLLKTATARWITGTLVTTIAGILPFAISLWQIPTKRISYDVFAQTFDYPAERVKTLAFVVGDRRVNNIELATVRITNNGSAPIARSDFDDDLIVQFPDNAELLTAEVRRAVPESMKVDGTQSKTRFVIKPMLLNPGDEIVVSAVLTYPERNGPVDPEYVLQQLKGTHISVSTHVAGMRPPTRIESTFHHDYFRAVIGAVCTLFYGYLGASFFSAVRNGQAIPAFERLVLCFVVLTGTPMFWTFLTDAGWPRWAAAVVGLACIIVGAFLGVWRMSARIESFSRRENG
jgi:hypothetical protein